jgi:hypothetical protein
MRYDFRFYRVQFSVLSHAILLFRRTDPQFRLAGECNVWISKAGNSSKGVGIKLFDRMSQVQVGFLPMRLAKALFFIIFIFVVVFVVVVIFRIWVQHHS